MTEQFLHYVWLYQHFDHQELCTTSGLKLSVISPGSLNHNSGPDFFSSRIKLDDLFWVGKVEIHIKSSDWYAHGHQDDPNYENVILHVVWAEDKTVTFENGEPIPTLELQGKIPKELLFKSNQLIKSPQEIPCAPHLDRVESIQISSMLSRTLVERLQKKSTKCLQVLKETGDDWEETTYRMIGRSFGAHLNQDNFERLCQSLPLSILRKHAGKRDQIMALIFGQGGFLEEEYADPYPKSLQLEYMHLKRRHGIESSLSRFQWRFHRIRPANFPTRRIAQLSHLLAQHPNLYQMILGDENPLVAIQSMTANEEEYWNNHYDFDLETKQVLRKTGSEFLSGIVINAIVPILAASSTYCDDSTHMDKAIQLLERLSPENNKITRKYDNIEFPNLHAADSQGILTLYHEFCKKKRCLACNIGVSLLKP